MSIAETIRDEEDFCLDEERIAVSPSDLLPPAPLDERDVKLLVDFFLLLKKWDMVDTKKAEGSSSHIRAPK